MLDYIIVLLPRTLPIDFYTTLVYHTYMVEQIKTCEVCRISWSEHLRCKQCKILIHNLPCSCGGEETYMESNTIIPRSKKLCERCGVSWSAHDRCKNCTVLLHGIPCDCTSPRDYYTNKIYDREYYQRKRII